MEGISIIIPTYNRAPLVKDAIRSVLDQKYPGTLEIIVSDDGSTDETLAVTSSFEPKVRILRKPRSSKSQGASGARNRGILKATQPYICFLDSDDFYLPGHLTNMVEAIQSKADYGFALCNSLEMLDTGKEKGFRRWTKPNIEARDMSNLAITTIHFAHTNAFIFKKEVFDSVGLFKEHIKVGEDSDMWMRINEKFKGKYVDNYGSVIRKHNLEQLTDTPKQGLLKGHYEVYQSAIMRYHTQGLNDSYRLRALWLLSLKYKIGQWPVFKTIYLFMGNRNKRKKTQTLLDPSWQPLEYFVDDSFQ